MIRQNNYVINYINYMPKNLFIAVNNIFKDFYLVTLHMQFMNN